MNQKRETNSVTFHWNSWQTLKKSLRKNENGHKATQFTLGGTLSFNTCVSGVELGPHRIELDDGGKSCNWQDLGTAAWNSKESIGWRLVVVATNWIVIMLKWPSNTAEGTKLNTILISFELYIVMEGTDGTKLRNYCRNWMEITNCQLFCKKIVTHTKSNNITL